MTSQSVSHAPQQLQRLSSLQEASLSQSPPQNRRRNPPAAAQPEEWVPCSSPSLQLITSLEHNSGASASLKLHHHGDKQLSAFQCPSQMYLYSSKVKAYAGSCKVRNAVYHGCFEQLCWSISQYHIQVKGPAEWNARVDNAVMNLSTQMETPEGIGASYKCNGGV